MTIRASDNKLYCWSSNQVPTQFTISSSTALTTGQWYNIVFVSPGIGNTLKLYVNGTDVSSGAGTYTTSNLFQSNSPIVVGNSGSGSSYEVEGTLDELCILNKALSTTEVSTLDNNGLGFTYPFSGSSATTPTVTTTAISGITVATATSGGNVTSDGGVTVTSKGVCWSTSSNPVYTGMLSTNDGSGTGNYSSSITGLTPSTVYHVRAYATNSQGTSYGSDVQFTTSSVNTPPVVTTTTIINITQATASGGGNVTSDGGASVTIKGVCWNTSSNPTISNSHTSDGAGTGLYTSSLTGLVANTMYHVRSYATNNVGTSYGSDVQFTTSPPVVIPTVTTTSASGITIATDSTGGNVTSDGGSLVTARGVAYSTSANPTISGNITSNGTGTGSFISSLTGLAANTLYYVRAYATNSAGTSYGSQVTFTTTSTQTVPVLTTSAPTVMATTFITIGGNITSDGGSSVTARGVCWGLAPGNTISGSHTSDGTGTGLFVSSITGLTRAKPYFIRAYATNSTGTAYGQEVLVYTAGYLIFTAP